MLVDSPVVKFEPATLSDYHWPWSLRLVVMRPPKELLSTPTLHTKTARVLILLQPFALNAKHENHVNDSMSKSTPTVQYHSPAKGGNDR